MRTEDDYSRLVDALTEQLSGESPDARIRKIAGDESDKRLIYLVGIVGFLWAAKEYGSIAIAAAVGLGIVWMVWRFNFDPKHDRQLVVSKAEDLVRLQITAEAFAAGATVWELEEEEYSGDERQIHATDNDHWKDFWERTYTMALKLKNLSPSERRRRISKAATASCRPPMRSIRSRRRCGSWCPMEPQCRAPPVRRTAGSPWD